MTQPAMTSTRHMSSGARAASTEARALPLRRASVTVTAHAGLARVVYEQHFENPHDVPLSVTYTMPLPADGAVSLLLGR